MPTVQVNFGWDPNAPGDNVTSYIINRGIQTGVYTTSTNVGNVLTGSDGVTQSRVYFWALTAQNAVGISTPSSELFEFVFVPQPASPGPARMVVG
jgi:hypothetical protein